VTERPLKEIDGLRRRDDPLGRLAGLPSDELLLAAGAQESAGEATPAVTAAAGELRRIVAKLNREITSKQQERMAMAGASFVMVLLGAISALRHKDSLPLVVYLWSFFPALAMILLISSGQQHTHSDDVPVGVAILWSGVAGCGVLTFVEFLKIARH